MGRGPRTYRDSAGISVRKITIPTADGEASTTSPTITVGTGAPSASLPNGSIYLRMDGASATTVYVRAGGAWTAVTADGTDYGAGGLLADLIAASTTNAPLILESDGTSQVVGLKAAGTTATHRQLSVSTANMTATRTLTMANADVDLGEFANLRTAVWPMGVLGAWAIDGDAAETNGAGMVGATPTLTEQAAALALSVDVSDTTYTLSTSATGAGYTANYQLFPDTPADGDYAAFGAALPFCELAFAMSTASTYTAAGVLTWEYPTAQDTWATLTLAFDGTSASTADGTLAFGQSGAITFVPPTDWVQTTENSQAGYWIRAKIATGKAANMTQVPITNSKEHEIVTPTDGFICPASGSVTKIRLSDNASTLHTTADVKFIVMNYTTGVHSGSLTFAQDLRTDSWTGLTLAVAASDVLGVVCVQEDGAAEPSGVLLELTVALAA